MKTRFIFWMACLFVCQSFKLSAQWQALPMAPISMFPTNSSGHNYYSTHFLGGDTVISFVNYGSDQGGRRKALYSFNANQTALEYFDVPSFRTETRGMYNTSDGHFIVSLDLKINRSNITQWDTLTDGFFRSSAYFSSTQYHAKYFDKPNVPLYYANDFFSYTPLYKRSSFFGDETIIIDSFTYSWTSGGSEYQSFYALDTNYLWARLPFSMGIIPSTAAGSIGRLHKSIDGGRSWTFVSTNLDTMYNLQAFDMRDIYFVSKDTGYMAATRRPGDGQLVNRQSIIFKTTDGGRTWNKIFERTTGVEIMFRDLLFINQNIGFGYHSQNGSLVYKTEDGGITWHEQPSLNALGGTAIREMKYENGTLVVRNLLNVFYSKTLGDPVPTTSLAKQQQTISDFAVYPNPTSTGKIYLRWKTEHTNESNMWVYDVMGRIVHQAIHKPEAAGEVVYPLETHLSPGTYFVKMIQGEQQATKTFVVIGR